MRKIRTGIVVFLVSAMLSLLLCSCGGGPGGTEVDYGDAAAFEEALNRGENLENKTLMFTVTELHPDSALGFNVCGGEHLNFISSRDPDLKVGDTAGVKATEITSLLGSWIIKYEKIDNPIIGDNTIVSSAQEGNASEEQKAADTDEVSADPSAVTEEEIAIPEPSETETEDIVQESENAAGNAADNTAEKIAENAAENAAGNVADNPADNTAENTTENPAENAAGDTQEQSPLEIVDSKIVAFKDYFGKPSVSAYVAFKNNTDYCIGINSPRMDYQDNDGKLIATDQFANCIPEVAKPGQVFYLYSYHFSIKDVDTSNGLNYKPDGNPYEAKNFFEVELSDVSFKTGDIMDVSIIGRGTNNTDKNLYGEPGAVFYDSDNNVVGFCYSLESFDAGQTKSFEISGDMMSEEYDPSIVDHVDVFMQGNTY
jgi:hypothetical protein